MVNVKQITSFNLHAGAIYKLCTAHEDHLFYSASGDTYVARWDLINLKQDSFAIKLNDPVYTISYNKQLHQLYCGTSKGSIHIIDLELNKEIKHLKPSAFSIFSILNIDELEVLIIGDGGGNIHLYNSKSLSHLKTINIGNFKIRNIQYQQGLIWIAFGSGQILQYNLFDLKHINTINAHKGSVNCLLFLKETFYSGSHDAHLNNWNYKNENLVSLPLHNFAIYDLAYNSSMHLIASASRDKTIKIIDPSSNKFLLRIDKENYNGHALSVNSLLWLNFRNLLISAGDDKKIILWEVSNT